MSLIFFLLAASTAPAGWCDFPPGQEIQQMLCGNIDAKIEGPEYTTFHEAEEANPRLRSRIWTSWRDSQSVCVVGEAAGVEGQLTFFGYAVGHEASEKVLVI